MFKGLQSRYWAVLAFLGALFAAVPAYAATDPATLLAEASSLWDAVKVLVIGIIGFMILISIVKMAKRK